MKIQGKKWKLSPLYSDLVLAENSADSKKMKNEVEQSAWRTVGG